MPIMFVYCVVDSTKCVCLNILRSTGRPSITVFGNILACLAVMLPLGFFLAVRCRLGIVGLWAAMSTAWLLATIVYFVILMRTNWKEQILIQRVVNPPDNNNIDDDGDDDDTKL